MIETLHWAGWLAGIAIGGYVILQYILSGKPLGCSSTYGHLCATASRLDYFAKGEFANWNSWRLWFTLGLPLGGLIAVLTGGHEWHASFSMGEMYEKIYSSFWLKAFALTLGGIFIGFGARMAGGCTSGHTIVGVSLLHLPSIMASAAFFLGGLFTVQLLFRVMGAE